jgi:hypothetical protein
MEETIRSFVCETLCNDNGILENAFPLTETVLKRSGAVCGVMFCLHGPRAVKFTAVWEKDTDRILFYGADGKRYRVHSVALHNGVAIDKPPTARHN